MHPAHSVALYWSQGNEKITGDRKMVGSYCMAWERHLVVKGGSMSALKQPDNE